MTNIERDEIVLNMWAAGAESSAIAAAVGELRNGNISSIVSKARSLGDPRAMRRERSLTFKTNGLSNIGRYQRRKMLDRLPASITQLQSAVQSYTGPVTICNPGVHLGHRAKVLDYFNI